MSGMPVCPAVIGSEFFRGDLDFHPEERGTERLSLGVCTQRQRAASPESAVQQEVERSDVGKFESVDRPRAQFAEVRLHSVGSDLPSKHRIVAVIDRDQSNVGSIALVTGADVGDLDQAHSHARLYCEGTASGIDGRELPAKRARCRSRRQHAKTAFSDTKCAPGRLDA